MNTRYRKQAASRNACDEEEPYTVVNAGTVYTDANFT